MKFMLKETLIRNIGLLIKITFSIILFIIGLREIAGSEDPTTSLFLTVIWCYIFLSKFRFMPTLIYGNEHGETWEER